MIVEGIKIIADSGCFLRRVADGCIVGSEYVLGMLYYLDNKPLKVPIEEAPSDYEDVLISDVYANRVDALVREKYSISDELALQRQRETKPEQFQEYFIYCEECKKRAKEELGITD